MRPLHTPSLRTLLPIGPLLLIAACSGSSGSTGPAASSSGILELVGVSVRENAVWQINRAIEFAFSEEVDFLSISSNTIQIRTTAGRPATGTFSFKADASANGVDETTVLWQPRCPTQADLGDAGLVPFETYVLEVVGETSLASNTVRSRDGARSVRTTQTRRFTTPSTTEISKVFLDPVPGPPLPVVRAKGQSGRREGVSYVELADDAARIYFELDATTQTYGVSPVGAEAPLNLYSEASKQVAVSLEFNQAVNPGPANISERRLRLEIEDAAGNWIAIDTRVELISNCTSSGATVRLEPIGLLPAGGRFRVAVLPGFEDIVGNSGNVSIDDFGVTRTETLAYAGLTPPEDGADEVHESFDFGGSGLRSLQDEDALFSTPQAEWANGRLTAAFDFEGNGGPRGNFDWLVKAGETFTFDTATTDIVGGDGFRPTAVQTSVGGLVDVRNLKIEAGGVLRVQGPNPMRLNATGYVRIEGDLDLSGFNAKNVATLNTGRQPEIGGAGAGGGGRGGFASEVTNNSTPRGGSGFGPMGVPGLGGQGGESGFAPGNAGKDSRRPGGGGGGRLGADYDTSNPEGGLWGQPGWPGHPATTGAESGTSPAAGGLAGKGPFIDGDPTNDFFGVKPSVSPTLELLGLIKGELPALSSGSGGGGGGDAIPSRQFPPVRWNANSDEKGGGGGGGAGGLRIRALGEIVFGPVGRIRANGGRGGTGENTGFLDHIGGTGGSGSGGHIMLESATRIDFTDGDPSTAPIRSYVNARGAQRTIGSKNPSGSNVPNNMSWGGAGSPGIIQLHVPDPITPPGDDPDVTKILVPQDPNNMFLPVGIEDVSAPAGLQMIPTFGARSTARSKWISIGAADIDPTAATPSVLRFLFGGTDAAGDVATQVSGSLQRVLENPELLSDVPLSSGTGGDGVIEGDRTVELSGAALAPLIGTPSNDLYLRTPALLNGFRLRLEESSRPSVVFRHFEVVDASWGGQGTPLALTVDVANGISLTSFLVTEAQGNPVQCDLVPRYFQVVNETVSALPDTMPLNTYVRIRFEATGEDANGNPDEANVLVPRTPDITRLNAPNVGPGQLQFFRFEVEFNLASDPGQGVQVGTRPLSLEFLKIPFRF